MSTDTPSPAAPAPTDRGERMSTPTPDRSQWSVTVTVPSDLPGAMRDSLFGRVANAAHLWEPSTRDGWDVDVSAGPAASAPQGDTAGVIERAAAIIHKNACDCGPSSGHSAEFRNEFGEPDEGHHETARELAAAGLLAVAASPATPQAADEVDRPMVPHPTISESHIVPEVHITFRELADGEWDTSTWTEVAPGVNVQKDQDGRLACIEVETWKHAATKPAAPAPADDEAALVERMAAAIAKDDGFDWRSGEWNDVYLSRARAALAELKEGHRA